MSTENKIRYIRTKGVTYIRAEDVQTLLLEFGGSEETDVRERMGQLVRNLTKAIGEN